MGSQGRPTFLPVGLGPTGCWPQPPCHRGHGARLASCLLPGGQWCCRCPWVEPLTWWLLFSGWVLCHHLCPRHPLVLTKVTGQIPHQLGVRGHWAPPPQTGSGPLSPRTPVTPGCTDDLAPFLPQDPQVLCCEFSPFIPQDPPHPGETPAHCSAVPSAQPLRPLGVWDPHHLGGRNGLRGHRK